MKLATDNESAFRQCQINLPFGLIGLADLQWFDLTRIKGSWPFMSMVSTVGDKFTFVVVDPRGAIPDYEIELSDEDAEALQIQSGEQAIVLNIVTIHSSKPLFVTVNLAGPVIVNRETLKGKQVIIENSKHYSTRHVLIDGRSAADVK
jgi:flagellar assembly factor FliW